MNDSEIGPSLTAIVAFQCESSTVSSSFAPGMHGMMRGTSISSAHACSGGAGTSNEFSSFRRRAARVSPRDELGQDRDGDLLLRRRPEIEARGTTDARERLFVDSALAQL